MRGIFVKNTGCGMVNIAEVTKPLQIAAASMLLAAIVDLSKAARHQKMLNSSAQIDQQ
jgi:hypothetical protein